MKIVILSFFIYCFDLLLSYQLQKTSFNLKGNTNYIVYTISPNETIPSAPQVSAITLSEDSMIFTSDITKKTSTIPYYEFQFWDGRLFTSYHDFKDRVHSEMFLKFFNSFDNSLSIISKRNLGSFEETCSIVFRRYYHTNERVAPKKMQCFVICNRDIEKTNELRTEFYEKFTHYLNSQSNTTYLLQLQTYPHEQHFYVNYYSGKEPDSYLNGTKPYDLFTQLTHQGIVLLMKDNELSSVKTSFTYNKIIQCRGDNDFLTLLETMPKTSKALYNNKTDSCFVFTLNWSGKTSKEMMCSRYSYELNSQIDKVLLKANVYRYCIKSHIHELYSTFERYNYTFREYPQNLIERITLANTAKEIIDNGYLETYYDPKNKVVKEIKELRGSIERIYIELVANVVNKKNDVKGDKVLERLVQDIIDGLKDKYNTIDIKEIKKKMKSGFEDNCLKRIQGNEEIEEEIKNKEESKKRIQEKEERRKQEEIKQRLHEEKEKNKQKEEEKERHKKKEQERLQKEEERKKYHKHYYDKKNDRDDKPKDKKDKEESEITSYRRHNHQEERRRKIHEVSKHHYVDFTIKDKLTQKEEDNIETKQEEENIESDNSQSNVPYTVPDDPSGCSSPTKTTIPVNPDADPTEPPSYQYISKPWLLKKANKNNSDNNNSNVNYIKTQISS